MPLFKILALGDSVMWGQGLAPEHRFVNLVANFLKSPNRQVDLASLAHSGAAICPGPAPFTQFQDALFGELPRTFPSISSQLATAAGAPGFDRYLQIDNFDPPPWQDHKRQLALQISSYRGVGGAPPDLILIDGGINDLSAFQIVIPWFLGNQDPCPSIATTAPAASGVSSILGALRAASGDLAAFAAGGLPALEPLTDDLLRQLIDQTLTVRMRALIPRVADAFPQSRVIVTGYFPIFTRGSLGPLTSSPASLVAPLLFARTPKPEVLHAALAWALHPSTVAQQPAVANRIIAQSALWYAFSTQRLTEIVDEANRTFGDRFSVASPVFGPDHGALAPASLLWTLSSLADHVIEELLRLFDAQAQPAIGAVPALLPHLAALGAPAVLGTVEFALALLSGVSLATDEARSLRTTAARAYYVDSPAGRSDPATTAVNGFVTGAASAGHPNRAGADAYFTAIKQHLP